MLYVFAIFFVTMLASAVVMEYLFAAFGWIPERLTTEQLGDFLAVKLDFTLIMTSVMLVVTAALYWISRTRARGGMEEASQSGPQT